MKALNALFSGWFMGLLLIVFAVVIGYATFVENDYGPETSRLLIYNAWWFELILILMVVNFSGMIFTRRLFMRANWNVLLIHLALVLIIIGAGITRYFGHEGIMHIREGESNSTYKSIDTYFMAGLTGDNSQSKLEEKILLSSASKGLMNRTATLGDQEYSFRIVEYIPNAKLQMVPASEGESYIEVVAGLMGGRMEFQLKEGETKFMHGFSIAFGDTTRKDMVNVIQEDGKLLVRLPRDRRASPDTPDPVFKEIETMSVQELGAVSFVIKGFEKHGKEEYAASNEMGGKPLVRLLVNDKTFEMQPNMKDTIHVLGNDIIVSIGQKDLELPFSLKLEDFILDRYPGSNSPSSFKSVVVLSDPANKVEMPYEIFMNNILNYGGYRFFQSSYDDDELGTVLSVNHDYWGTFVTYIGYFFLFASLLASIFLKNSRVQRLSFQLSEVHKRRKGLVTSMLAMFFLASTSAFSQVVEPDKRHAANFGEVLVQNKEGRIEPLNTLATKILVKISKKSSYKGMTADQVILSMMANHEPWKNEPVIKVEDENIQAIIGIEGEYASFNDFVEEDGYYKLKDHVEKANLVKPAMRGNFEKSLIYVDERINVFYMTLSGSLLNIFPLEGDPNNRWTNAREFHNVKGHGTEEGDLHETYMIDLKNALKTGDYSKADHSLNALKEYQRKTAADIVPPATQTKLEVIYNKANIFKRLFPYYFILGIILIGLFFMKTFTPKYEFSTASRVLYWIVLLAFVLQTAGLILRWYVSGHAPWSNGYESMIYISWATMLAGFIFHKRSEVSLGVTSVIAGITLLTAHMSWLNPEITNLVPVLKSHWLTIHVATITASYGFLALSCMMGFLNLIILIFRNDGNLKRVNLTLRELSLIIELAMSVGLVLLVIGNFLGAIWANESWGRYWGWDPKETWTLVTIILYSFTLHLTLIPSIRNNFTFSFMATISFGAVLMTYFGVNYYLSGLHSYAQGEAPEIPGFVYYSIVVIILVSILAAYNEKVYHKFYAKQNGKK